MFGVTVAAKTSHAAGQRFNEVPVEAPRRDQHAFASRFGCEKANAPHRSSQLAQIDVLGEKNTAKRSVDWRNTHWGVTS